MIWFKNKKTTCCDRGEGCSPTKSVSESGECKTTKIIVLGACCSNSAQTFENVKTAAKQLGLDTEVQNIGDFALIASYGVMSTPALVVDGKVCVQGKKITVDEAVVYIKKALQDEAS